MLGWLRDRLGASPPNGLSVTCEVTLKPDPDQPDIAGYFVTLGVPTFEEGQAIAQAKAHLAGSGVADIQIDGIEPVFDAGLKENADPIQIGGRIFYGHED